jgi:outer membrane protein assembly factor BamB
VSKKPTAKVRNFSVDFSIKVFCGSQFSYYLVAHLQISSYQNTKIMKKSTFFLLLFTIFRTNAQNIETVLPLKWKTRIGQTTYRTNILFSDGKVWIGSNGNTLDKSEKDELDAVIVIEPKSGNIVEKIAPKVSKDENGENPDTDVNGIALDGNKLYFGTDNKTLYCYDLTSKSFLWEYKTPQDALGGNYGNIESCPVVVDLNNDGEKDVIITIRGKGVAALNGKTGKPLWINILSQSEGAFLTSPCAIDVNNDKIPDIITGGWVSNYYYGDGKSLLYALDGNTGKPIWQYNLGSGLKSSPIIVKKGKKTAIMVATTYSMVYVLGLDGKLYYAINFQMPDEAPYYGGISGLYATPVLTPNETMVIGSSWWSNEQDGLWVAHLQKAKLEQVGGISMVSNPAKKFYGANRISASGVVGQITEKKWQIAVPTEKGELLLYDEQEKLLKRMKMPSGSECTPYLGDIDGDKKPELLIASYDGFLYCYQLPIKNAKIFTGQFRHNNTNQAEIKIK